MSSNCERESYKYITATDKEEEQMNDSGRWQNCWPWKQLATETVTSAVLTEGFRVWRRSFET